MNLADAIFAVLYPEYPGIYGTCAAPETMLMTVALGAATFKKAEVVTIGPFRLTSKPRQ